jgi:hypothetical protein
MRELEAITTLSFKTSRSGFKSSSPIAPWPTSSFQSSDGKSELIQARADALQERFGFVDSLVASVCLGLKLRSDDIHQCGAGVVVTLIEPSIEFDENELTISILAGPAGYGRPDEFNHGRFADAPGSRHTDRNRPSAGLDHDFSYGIGNARKVQEIALGLVVVPHRGAFD